MSCPHGNPIGGCDTCDEVDAAFEAGKRSALAEQPAQQEPVAWMELLREARDNCKASIVEEGISAIRKEYRIDLEARLTAALNTSPPAQRTWVGMTNKDITEIFDEVPSAQDDPWWLRYARTIEAKLKEKNT